MLSKIKLIVSEILHKLNYSFPKKGKDEENNILDALKKDGYYVYPNFYSQEECETLRRKADDFFEQNPNKIKKESNGCDWRVYGVDRYSSEFLSEKLFSFSYRLFNKFSWSKKPAHFLLLGKIIAGENNLGSGAGWHRDSPISHQFKTILYLSDVNEENGPFQYVKGSHLYSSIIKTASFLNKNCDERRFKDEEIESTINSGTIPNVTTFLGKAGTLLLVDTRGLHRGSPLKAGNRYALTNYHFSNGVKQDFFQIK